MTLIRRTPKTTRLYSVALYPTLFDDYLLVHHCGTACTTKANRSYFDTKKEALYHSLNVLSSKRAEGYVIKKPAPMKNSSAKAPDISA